MYIYIYDCNQIYSDTYTTEICRWVVEWSIMSLNSTVNIHTNIKKICGYSLMTTFCSILRDYFK